MKLYLIERKKWNYNEARAYVIRAEGEDAARRIAVMQDSDIDAEEWILAARSSCERITEDGNEEIILCDFLED